MTDEYSELHEQVDKSDLDTNTKNTLHKSLKDAKDNPTALKQIKDHLISIFKPKEVESTSTAEITSEPESTPETKPNKPLKADLIMSNKDIPENCYYEIDCEGKSKTVLLPKQPTLKPLRIRPQGTGTLIFLLSTTDASQIHEVDRSQIGYKFTDLHWNGGRQMWIAVDKFDPQ